MIEIDGSAGGGQILRYALTFSALTKKPFRITHIRKQRKNPGLARQHIACIEAHQQWSGAKATDVHLGSDTISFYPTQLPAKRLEYDIGTAGSTTLVLQSLLLPLCFAKGRVKVHLKGGTDVPWSIPYDTFAAQLFYFKPYVASISTRLIKRGYYPKGGGEIELSITPKVHREAYTSLDEFRKELPPLKLTVPNNVQVIKGRTHASQTLAQSLVAERIAKGAKVFLRKEGIPVVIQSSYTKTESTGCGISLWCLCSTSHEEDHSAIVTADTLGEERLRAEAVGMRAAQELVATLAHVQAIDIHTADSLIPLLALAGGTLRPAKMTQHIATAIAVAQQFGFSIQEKDGLIQAQRA